MAQGQKPQQEAKRDILDDLIDIQKDLQGVSNPLDSIVDIFDDSEQKPVWNPADYKERPRALPALCAQSLSGSCESCNACVEVCPTDAINIRRKNIIISDECRKCGLCLGVCPTEALIDNSHTPKKLFEKIISAATSHEQVYITCTRALGRLPKANEIVLPCVGMISAELWFALMTEADNISVYLPLGICDRCKTTTGEDVMAIHIAQAEQWLENGIDLVCEEEELNHTVKRSYERKAFLQSIAKSSQKLLTATSPALAGAQIIAKRLDDHMRRVGDLERSLLQSCGLSGSLNNRKILNQRRQLLIAALAKRPDLLKNFTYRTPICDSSRCTRCADCVYACPTKAISLDRDGRFSVEQAYCVDCSACVEVCKPRALSMEQTEADVLLVEDTEGEQRRRQQRRQAAEIDRLKTLGREKLDAFLETLEKLDEEERSED